eukprot:scaffold5828_cov85-Skeletonema_dohrnii-CCMP3373.AAC.3
MNIMVKDRRQERPDGSTADGFTVGDETLVISEVKTLTSGSIPNNVSSGAFRSDDVDKEDAAAAFPNAGTAAAGSSAEESSTNKVEPAQEDRPVPPQDDVSDDVVATPLDDDGIKLCEEGCVSPSPINEYDDFQDNGSSNNNELQPLCRDPSVQTQESDFTKRCLPEDTFSFLIYSRGKSCTFFLATFVFLFQIAIYAVLAVDIIDVSKKKNPFKLPVNVETPVRIAEALAIVVAIITQDDVRKAVNLVRDGCDEDLAKAFPGATKAKWILSIALRAIEGLFGLFLTFLLIMRSTTVIDLLLNFLAMEFVSLLDDVVFAMAREGFFGRGHLQKEAMKVSNTFYHVSRFAVESRNATFVTVLYFFTLLVAFFTGYGIIVTNQNSGKYLCENIFAQYGDEVVPMLGMFSGMFWRGTQSFDGRLIYSDIFGTTSLAYCKKEKRWTLSMPTDNNSDPCNNWYAASSVSKDFDILTTANSQWFVKTPTKGVVPLSQHFMACHDCGHIENDSGDSDNIPVPDEFDINNNFCGDFGTCQYNGCVCKVGRFGLRCEYSEPCKTLEINKRGEGFIKADGSNFASEYYPLVFPPPDNQDFVTSFNRPIYTSLSDPWGDNQTLPDDFDLILHVGVRWILTSKSLFSELKDVNGTGRLVSYFWDDIFNTLSANYSASFVSEPVFIGNHLDDQTSPFGLRWMYSSASDNAFGQRLQPDYEKGFIETKFFCAVCNDSTNRCPSKAVCQSNGKCGSCPNGSSGTMCQIPPESSGNSTIFDGN